MLTFKVRPTAKAAGFTTWNPSDIGPGVTLSGGNLVATMAAGFYGARSISAKSAGKYYVEFKFTSGTNAAFGLGTYASSLSGNWPGADSVSWGVLSVNGYNYTNNTSVSPSVGAFTSGTTVIGMAVDLNAGTVLFSLNGVAGANALTISGTPLVHIMVATYSGAGSITLNAGATAFDYTVPSGFTAGWPS